MTAVRQVVNPDPMQARTNARLAAVQALYQMEATGAGVDSVILEFRMHRLGGEVEGRLLHEADDDYFAALVLGVVRLQAKIDPMIERRLAKAWTLARLDATARAILRASAYELLHNVDVPARAIMNEYVEIANAFSSGDDLRFINAVLDAVAHDLRPEEFTSGAAGRAIPS